jgi:hypothetical protein
LLTLIISSHSFALVNTTCIFTRRTKQHVLDSLRRNNLCHWSMECYYGLIFSLQNPSTSGMVLEDFDTSFSDKFYHSHLDDMCELIYFLVVPPPPPPSQNLRFRPRLFFVFTVGKCFCKNLIFFASNYFFGCF